MQFSAPAKINLSFRIKERRADGFHEIETLMAPISLADRITIERVGDAGGIQFTCDDPSLPADDDNLGNRIGARKSMERMFDHGFAGNLSGQLIEPHPLAASCRDDDGA